MHGAYMPTDRHKQESGFFLWKKVFTDLSTDSFGGRGKEGEESGRNRGNRMTMVNMQTLVFKSKYQAMALFKHAFEIGSVMIYGIYEILSLFHKISGVPVMKKTIKWAFGYKIYST